MISIDDFRIVIEKTPLVSIDFIVKRKGKYLLGKRVNKPAQGYFFTPGGRIFKNETISKAFSRLSLKELGIAFNHSNARFLGIYEHFYEESFVSDQISTHYIVLAYMISIEIDIFLPTLEHNDYRYFSKEELLKNSNVHDYVKNYFIGAN